MAMYLIVCLCIFIVPASTLHLPWLRFFRAFSSVVRQMSGCNSQIRGTARTLPNIFVLFYILFVLCRSVYCLYVNVYCTTANGWQSNCSLTNMSYILRKKQRLWEHMDWIHQTQDRHKWRAMLNNVMNLKVSSNARNFLAGSRTSCVSRRTSLLHGDSPVSKE